jgi:hypothetical protein
MGVVRILALPAPVRVGELTTWAVAVWLLLLVLAVGGLLGSYRRFFPTRGVSP